MNCEGKCQLKKELNKAAKEESNNKIPSTKIFENVELASHNAEINFTRLFKENVQEYFAITPPLYYSSMEIISPPPKI